VTHLLDNSVYVRIPQHKRVAEAVDMLARHGHVGRCSMFELEALYSTRSQDYEQVRHRLHAFAFVPTHQADWDRATDVMSQLADSGQHRAVALPDLIVAAVAERTQLMVLHYHRDFEVIASVTGQSVQAVVPLGSI
jgi:predicted nucleic acid-binding protein